MAKVNGNSVSDSRMSQYFQVLLRLSSHDFAADRDEETSETSSIANLVSLAMWENSHTGLFRVRQTDRTLVIVGRRKARVAALIPERARTVARAD